MAAAIHGDFLSAGPARNKARAGVVAVRVKKREAANLRRHARGVRRGAWARVWVAGPALVRHGVPVGAGGAAALRHAISPGADIHTEGGVGGVGGWAARCAAPQHSRALQTTGWCPRASPRSHWWGSRRTSLSLAGPRAHMAHALDEAASRGGGAGVGARARERRRVAVRCVAQHRVRVAICGSEDWVRNK